MAITANNLINYGYLLVNEEQKLYGKGVFFCQLEDADKPLFFCGNREGKHLNSMDELKSYEKDYFLKEKTSLENKLHILNQILEKYE